jgi:dolichol-phosphate mannosyltransferase
MQQSALIIIPTYNEIENIELMINTVLALDPDYHILVVDDGSPDGTGNKVKELQSIYSGRLHLIERAGKQGLGTAYITGFKYGIDKSYTYIIEMDADFSHDPNEVPNLIQACKSGADVSVGSRYIKGGGIQDWGKDRLILSYGASLFVRAITWMSIRDTTAGFVCYKRKVLETIDLDKVQFKGYAFQIEMKYTAYRLGFKIVEIPIIFKERELGESKMDSSIIKEAVAGVIGMRLRSYKPKA